MQVLQTMTIWLFTYLDWLVALILLVAAAKLAHEMWLFYRQQHYKRNTPRSYYEIKIPRELTKGPAAMDQFFASLYAFGNWPGSIGEKYWDGETTRHMSFEIVGINGKVHLFMQSPTYYADAIKAALYAQYPEIEISEIEDYMSYMPRSYDQLSERGYELWTQEIYTEEKIFPIKTYAEFERTGQKSDERDVDPVAFFYEYINKMPSNEAILMQFVLKAALPDWQNEGKKKMRNLYDELKVYEQGQYKGRQDRDTEYERTASKAIDQKTSKDGFKTLIRYMHIAPKETFSPWVGYRNFFAFFTQLTSNTNRFVKNGHILPKIDWYTFPFIFVKKRIYERNKASYKEYIKRYFPEETFLGQLIRSKIWRFGFRHKYSILNTEELATLFHPPTNTVITTGLMDRVESKRVAPPSGLPS